jgi:hypothetical protein
MGSIKYGVIAATAAAAGLLSVSTSLAAAEKPSMAVITVEYTGPSNHIIYPVIIGDSESALLQVRGAIEKRIGSTVDLSRIHFVSRRLMTDLTRIVEGFADRVPNKEDIIENGPGILVRITRPVNQRDFVLTVHDAVVMTDALKRNAKTDSRLKKSLSDFQSSISLWLSPDGRPRNAGN